MHRILFSILLITSLFGAKYLAVLEIEPEGIGKSEARILTQRLTSKMIELSDYTIVERANIDKILKEQKFQHSGCTDGECAVEIEQLVNTDQQAGYHKAIWNANQNASGLYFVKMTAGSYISTQKLMLVK